MLFLIFLQIYPNEYSMFLKYISAYKISTLYPKHCYSSVTSVKVMILMNTGNLKGYNKMTLIYVPQGKCLWQKVTRNMIYSGHSSDNSYLSLSLMVSNAYKLFPSL